MRWSLLEHGVGGNITGQVVSDYVYEVTKYGCCDAPPTFVYFSMLDGRKLQTGHDSLSYEQLKALDESFAKE